MKKNGFTLIELAVAAIIIGILVLIGIPNMLKSTQRGYAVDAQRNLMAIYAAQHAWSESNGGSSFIICANLNECNTDLDLHIVGIAGTSYSCSGAGLGVVCTAQGANSLFTMNVTLGLPATINNTPLYCDALNYNPCCTLSGSANPRDPCP